MALIAGTRYRLTAWQSLGSGGSSADYQRLLVLIASLVLPSGNVRLRRHLIENRLVKRHSGSSMIEKRL